MAESNGGLNRIGQIAVNVKDVARAKEFYRDVLGVRFLFEVPDMAFFDVGGIRLMLGIASAPEYDHAGSILYYAVEDIEATEARLRSRGVKFRQEAREVADLGDRVLWLAFFEDTESNVLALMSEVPKPS